MTRFKMMFNNSGSTFPKYNNLGGENFVSFDRQRTTTQRSIPLNAPMIDRVHKAKPGCGACGKKVA
jgi:hypothetical protein